MRYISVGLACTSWFQSTFKSRLKTHLFNIAYNDQLELWCCGTPSAPQDL